MKTFLKIWLEFQSLLPLPAERGAAQYELAKAKARSQVCATMQDDAFVKNEVATK